MVPEHQLRGVGKRLVRAAQKRATDLGVNSILLVGIPSYYLHFGFELLSRYPITLPFDTPDDERMILPLAQHALDGIVGRVRFAEGWFDH